MKSEAGEESPFDIWSLPYQAKKPWAKARTGWPGQELFLLPRVALDTILYLPEIYKLSDLQFTKILTEHLQRCFHSPGFQDTDWWVLLHQ